MIPDEVQAFLDGEEEPMPEGAVARIIIQVVDTDDGESLVAKVSTQVEDLTESAAVLLALRGVADEYQHEVARKLAHRAMSGPDGSKEVIEIVNMLKSAVPVVHKVHP